MIRTAIRRAGVLAAATTLAGAAFAGAAAADTDHGKDPKKSGDVTTVTGIGGSADGGVASTKCVLPIQIGSAEVLSHLIPVIGNEDNDPSYNSQCNADASGGEGGAGIRK